MKRILYFSLLLVVILICCSDAWAVVASDGNPINDIAARGATTLEVFARIAAIALVIIAGLLVASALRHGGGGALVVITVLIGVVIALKAREVLTFFGLAGAVF